MAFSLSGILGKVKNKWKTMPKEEKVEAMTTLGAAAVTALSKPRTIKKQDEVGRIAPQGYKGPGIGETTQFPGSIAAPRAMLTTERAQDRAKLNRRLRSQRLG